MSSGSGFRRCGCPSPGATVTVDEYLVRRKVTYNSSPEDYPPVRKSRSDLSLALQNVPQSSLISLKSPSSAPLMSSTRIGDSSINVSMKTPYNTPYNTPKSSSFLSVPSGGGCCGGGGRSRSTSSLMDSCYNTSYGMSSTSLSPGGSRRSDSFLRPSGECGCYGASQSYLR
ncbi:hypothetical protein TcasGA2_TC003183 [Tribolium castaneum]|uniref:Uncharacterized protein n=1 Tax=Tribolium castaneum TaxID=7070 RepID=D6WEI5_TRICA|nr:hypothetical protein TcasGA2_TC003183 [Tribolium castaneum]